MGLLYFINMGIRFFNIFEAFESIHQWSVTDYGVNQLHFYIIQKDKVLTTTDG